jgi:DNA modification methylase
MTQKMRQPCQFETAHTVSTAALAAKLPWMVEMLPPSKLKPAKRNARTHNEKQIDLLADSILRFGFIKPVVIDDRGRIVAGEGAWLAARKLGLKLIPVIRVSHLSETQLRAYALADNQLATKSGWNRELLSLEFADLQVELPEIGLDLSMLGFEPGEVDAVLEDFAEGGADPADEIPELASGPAISQLGDLFVLGNHRLLVDDARDAAAFDQLMQGEVADMGIHDPPYNVRIQGNAGGRGRIKRREFACASGEMSPAQFIAFLKSTLGPCAHHSADGAIHYVFIDWRHVGELLTAGSEVFDDLKNMCVWVKNNAGQGAFYRSQHELVLVFKHGHAAHLNNFGLGAGGRTRSNVWRYAGVNSFRAGRMDELKMHPTVKPVAMIADAMRDCSRRGSIVLDAFAGSGSTIMAAEQLGRRAFCMEIDPHYADVAIRRWQSFTQRDAVLESTDQTFDGLGKDGRQLPSRAKSRRRR